MFTGIIEEVGTIKQIQKNPASAAVFTWQCPHRQSGEFGTRNAVRRKIWRTYCIGAY